MTPINAVGLELWSMTDEIVFDNFLVTDDKGVAEKWTEQTFQIKSAAEKASSGGAFAYFTALKGAAEERPLLWAVYVVVLLLPVLLISICLCPRSGPIKPETLAEAKKTDAVSPDDEKKEESADKEEKTGPGGDNKPSTKKSKASLEATEDDGDDEDEVDAEEEEEEAQEKNSESPRRSPRKRKSRKD